MQNPSSNTHVDTWPSRAEVVAALRGAAAELRQVHPEIKRIGYFGSLTDGVRYGFGSDADVLVVVTASSKPWIERASDYDLGAMPVPVDLLVYTEEELETLVSQGGEFGRAVGSTVWIQPDSP